MKKITFTNVYIKRVFDSTCSMYYIVKGQGLHHNGLVYHQESRSCLETYFIANISYNIDTKTYQLESKDSVLPPTIVQIAESGARVADLLRKEGFYRAEYSLQGFTFSNLNN